MKNNKKLTILLSVVLLAVLAVVAYRMYAPESTKTAQEETPVTVSAETVTETAEADSETADTDPLLLTVGGVEVYKSELESIAQQLYYYGYTSTASDYLEALNYHLYYNVAPDVLIAGREKELLGDSYETYILQFALEFETEIRSYAESTCADDATDEEKDAAYQSMLEMYATYGLTEDSYVNDSLQGEAFNVYTGTFDITVTEEEIQAAFDEEVASEKAYFDSNLAAYEYYDMYGYDLYYVPEGYRGILHILLDVDEELLDAYNDAADEETKAAAAQAILDSVKPTTDEIYAAFEAGTSFTDLIEKYNVDPGMTGDTLTTGYKVNAASTSFVQEFTDGAFAEEMKEPGCIGQPVLTSYGVHILYYLSDIPAGAVELTQEIHDTIADSLKSNNVVLEVGKRLRETGVVYTAAYADLISGANFMDEQ